MLPDRSSGSTFCRRGSIIGWTRQLITYALLDMPTIFISYRREDSAGYAGRLCESLERRLGSRQVFRDVDAIRPGQDFVDAIDARLRECRALVALIGREWLDAADVSGSRRLDQEND